VREAFWIAAALCRYYIGAIFDFSSIFASSIVASWPNSKRLGLMPLRTDSPNAELTLLPLRLIKRPTIFAARSGSWFYIVVC